MSERAISPLSLFTAALLCCAAALQGCAASNPDNPKAVPEEPPRPTMNHAAHLAQDLECIDCHDLEETGTPALPVVETCFECHDDLTQENERVRGYFDAIRQEDGTYKFEKLAYSPDIIVNHKGHAEYEVKCADCHGEPSERAYTRPAPLDLKARCMDCHTARGASNACATCHKETRKEKAPASHAAPGFRAMHGAQAPEGWQVGERNSCALCHDVPGSCRECHRESKPASHADAGFKLLHGRGETDVMDEPFAQTSCALCHTQASCLLCHQTTRPKSHTLVFARRTHGLIAGIERQNCQTCHKQDFCNRCHESTQPVSHRGSWGSPPYTHCLGCHDPLPANGCYVCHKNTLGHLTATALPAGLPHSAATDCRTCHSVIPHIDDGGNCRRCHR